MKRSRFSVGGAVTFLVFGICAAELAILASGVKSCSSVLGGMTTLALSPYFYFAFPWIPGAMTLLFILGGIVVSKVGLTRQLVFAGLSLSILAILIAVAVTPTGSDCSPL